jgi:hypothetical protein
MLALLASLPLTADVRLRGQLKAVELVRERYGFELERQEAR